jgi:dephospho-CoA kinase
MYPPDGGFLIGMVSERTYKIIGITGGIGSGKSTVGRMLESRGYTVLDTDAIARELTTAGSPILDQIVAVFGNYMLSRDGSLDRAKVASIVFSDPDKLRALECILHPAIQDAYHKVAEESGQDWVFILIPLLFEIKKTGNVDRIWLCFAPKELRLARAMNRDGASEAAILARMDHQMADELKIDMSNVVIRTDGKFEDVERQIDEALEGMTG